MKRRNKTERLGGGLGLSETDPTYMHSGIMMQIALQTGLHRPMHAQDFIRQTRDISEAEINDRKLTWAVCNIVAQRYLLLTRLHVFALIALQYVECYWTAFNNII